MNRTAVTDAELERGLHLARRLMDAVGERDQASNLVSAATLLRQQAYTLLVNAYDEVRRAISYLRWHEGDADSIAPSLWAGRTGRRTEEVPAPSPGAVPGTPGTPAAPGTTAPATNPIPVGFPGSSPFTS